mmetsp:Transcript_8598/g.15423  ORF Transcript_8598/g.15423 Transcript_8598/m.15423 type:complete len:108 (+) Transcript_8598:110-433(+)
MAGSELWAMLMAGQMDFVGQKQAFDIQFYVIWSSGLIGFVYGFIMQRFLYTFYIIFGATLFTVALCLPAWPLWNRNGLEWLEPQPTPDEGAKAKSTSKTQQPKKKAM